MLVGVVGFSLLMAHGHGQDGGAAGAPPSGTDARSYVNYGVATGSKGDLNGAIAAFNKAIAIDPKYAPAYYNRGFANALANNLDAAIADYNQTIQIDPHYTLAYYQRGSLQGRRGDLDDAISDFTQVIKLDPKYAPAYYNRGHVEYFKGDLDAATEQINQGLALDPNSPFSYFIRGLIRHAQGQREPALSDFQKSVGLNFPYAAYWVWITEMEAGRNNDARTDLTDALNRPTCFKPDDWPSQIASFLLERITRTQLMAKATTNNDNETRGRMCEAWFYCGMQKLLSGDPKDAHECFTAAVATGQKGSEEYVEASRELAATQKP